MAINQIPNIAKFHIGSKRLTLYVANEKVVSKSYIYDTSTYKQEIICLLALWICKYNNIPYTVHTISYDKAKEILRENKIGAVLSYEDFKGKSHLHYYVVLEHNYIKKDKDENREME